MSIIGILITVTKSMRFLSHNLNIFAHPAQNYNIDLLNHPMQVFDVIFVDKRAEPELNPLFFLTPTYWQGTPLLSFHSLIVLYRTVDSMSI